MGFIKFENYGRKIKSLFIIYADFESILVPLKNISSDIKL